ncbi:hypothetical protein EVAR_51347_1 [Eumeta japonica]|uniref:Uncharacterized protein n=1 Tax=Eumeta variegata TaxID=151549 RepID=A0A4C1XY87_EUMVA|nr:hypothetical protein EVAR_51347_1 [Eumeta japonica]
MLTEFFAEDIRTLEKRHGLLNETAEVAANTIKRCNRSEPITILEHDKYLTTLQRNLGETCGRMHRVMHATHTICATYRDTAHLSSPYMNRSRVILEPT